MIGKNIKKKIKDYFGVDVEIHKGENYFDEYIIYKEKKILVNPMIFKNILSETKYSTRGIEWDFETDWIIELSKKLDILN